jgi:CRP-like cAMP-binding protein
MKTQIATMTSADAADANLPPLAGVTPQLRELATGAALFRQGDQTIGIFVLLRGAVRLVRVTPDGTAVTLHLARPGEMFAEASLFAMHYHCDAIADCDSGVGLYPKAALTARLRQDPEALWKFSAELAHRLQSLRQRYELKQIRSAPQRVLQFLRLRSDAQGRYACAGALKELAAEVGLSHEALYRTLAALERQGLINRPAGGLCLLTGRRP